MSNRDNSGINLRIAILGYEAVGKTLLYRKIVSEANKEATVFIDSDKYIPTYGFTTSKFDWTFLIGKEKINGKITLFDTAGHELNQTLTKAHYASFDAFIFLFDTRKPHTLTYIYQELKRIAKLKKNIHGYLIGNTFGEKVPSNTRQRCSDLIKGYKTTIEYMELSLLNESSNSSYLILIDRLVYSILIRAYRRVRLRTT